MKNELDMELVRLFAGKSEPAQGEIFVERVSKRIARHRRAHRVMMILLAFAGAAILAAVTPWLMGLTGYIVLGTSLFAHSVVLLILSPVGCSIGGGVGLLFFFKARL
jgi:hypothetical protein